MVQRLCDPTASHYIKVMMDGIKIVKPARVKPDKIVANEEIDRTRSVFIRNLLDMKVRVLIRGQYTYSPALLRDVSPKLPEDADAGWRASGLTPLRRWVAPTRNLSP